MIEPRRRPASGSVAEEQKERSAICQEDYGRGWRGFIRESMVASLVTVLHVSRLSPVCRFLARLQCERDTSAKSAHDPNIKEPLASSVGDLLGLALPCH